MKLISPLLLLLLPSIQAAPPTISSALSRRSPAPIEVKLCRDIDLKGTCTTHNISTDQCVTQPFQENGKAMNDQLSSMITCRHCYCKLYEHADCKGNFRITEGRMQNIGKEWNDRVSSMFCYIQM